MPSAASVRSNCGDLLVRPRPLLLRGVALDPLDEHPAVPGAVQDREAAPARQHRPEPPEEVVALLVVRRGGELRHPHVPRVQRLDQALDRAALPGGVPALEDHAQRRRAASRLHEHGRARRRHPRAGRPCPQPQVDPVLTRHVGVGAVQVEGDGHLQPVTVLGSRAAPPPTAGRSTAPGPTTRVAGPGAPQGHRVPVASCPGASGRPGRGGQRRVVERGLQLVEASRRRGRRRPPAARRCRSRRCAPRSSGCRACRRRCTS